MSSLETELDAIAAETAERAIRRLGHRSAILEPEFRSQALDLPPLAADSPAFCARSSSSIASLAAGTACN